jgi:hypothetical protein
MSGASSKFRPHPEFGMIDHQEYDLQIPSKHQNDLSDFNYNRSNSPNNYNRDFNDSANNIYPPHNH